MKNNINRALLTGFLAIVFIVASSFVFHTDRKSVKNIATSFANENFNDVEIQDLINQYILSIKEIEIFESNDIQIYNSTGDLIAQGNENDLKLHKLLRTSDLLLKQGNLLIYMHE